MSKHERLLAFAQGKRYVHQVSVFLDFLRGKSGGIADKSTVVKSECKL